MFRVLAEDTSTNARIGLLETQHGILRTPSFLPVATKAVVKTLDTTDLLRIGAEGLIVNAFHLWLHGLDAIQEAGGLHEFMSWEKILFTDSGGFQVGRKDFNLCPSDEGFKLTSPKNGSIVCYSPRVCMMTHSILSSDVAFVLDDCPPYPSDTARLERSVQRSLKWAEECAGVRNKDQKLFGIAQGGTNKQLRKESANALRKMDFDGYGIGGLSMGEPSQDMFSSIKVTLLSLPKEVPKHMMGLGSPIEILESISMGVDIFDSAFPTRNARHGTFYTDTGRFDIRRSGFARVNDPLDKNCGCFTCTNYSASYLHYLFKEKEMLAYRLLSIHNLFKILELMAMARKAIKSGRYSEFKESFLSKFMS